MTCKAHEPDQDGNFVCTCPPITHRLVKDGEPVTTQTRIKVGDDRYMPAGTVQGSADDCWIALLDVQPFSTDYAFKYGGYAIIEL